MHPGNLPPNVPPVVHQPVAHHPQVTLEAKYYVNSLQGVVCPFCQSPNAAFTAYGQRGCADTFLTLITLGFYLFFLPPLPNLYVCNYCNNQYWAVPRRRS